MGNTKFFGNCHPPTMLAGTLYVLAKQLSTKISQPKKQNNRITIPGTNSTFSLEEIKAAAAKQHDAASPDENLSSIHSWNDPNFGGDDWLKPEDVANMIQNQRIPKKKKHSHKKKFGYENITKPIVSWIDSGR